MDRFNYLQTGLYDRLNDNWIAMAQNDVDAIINADLEERGIITNSSNNKRKISTRFRNNTSYTNNSQFMARNFQHHPYTKMKMMGTPQTKREKMYEKIILDLQASQSPYSPRIPQAFQTPLSTPSDYNYHTPSGPPIPRIPASFPTPSTIDSRSTISTVTQKSDGNQQGPYTEEEFSSKRHKRVIDMLRVLKAHEIFGQNVSARAIKNRSYVHFLF